MAVAIPPERTSQSPRSRLGSNRDPMLDIVVLVSVLMFMLLVTGVGLLVLQQAHN